MLHHNNCGTLLCFSVPVGPTTPWVWSVIRFDVQGNVTPLDHHIFPTYYVYEDSTLVGQFPQGDLEAFISLNQTSQRVPPEIP